MIIITGILELVETFEVFSLRLMRRKWPGHFHLIVAHS